MTVSVFDLFSIGIGPSSSHTVGPMRAARQFLQLLDEKRILKNAASIKVELFGSLGLTGKGHSTDIAILLGLQGERPEQVNPAHVMDMIAAIRTSKQIKLLNLYQIPFNEQKDLCFYRGKRLPYHSNAIRFTVFDEAQKEIAKEIYYSVGGGFIVEHQHAMAPSTTTSTKKSVPFAFKTASELLNLCKQHNLSVSELMYKNEQVWRTREEVRDGLLQIWGVMQECVKRGYHTEGILPGGLNVKRRASQLYKDLGEGRRALEDPVEMMEWVSLFALAVNEENAAGGRIVTAPTNGAAGIIPAVMHYYHQFSGKYCEEGIVTFLLVAGAIGILYKEGASLSAAEVGCQGEVGVACSMAAGGLAAVLGGNVLQIENAAEIGMEHNLGLTCDPVGGLVQIPCIERNTMGAIKAINSARLALRGDGSHVVSLDNVIETMRQTGAHMKTIYKETSKGGLAVNVTAC